jgi:hypothetical protein
MALILSAREKGGLALFVSADVVSLVSYVAAVLTLFTLMDAQRNAGLSTREVS